MSEAKQDITIKVNGEFKTLQVEADEMLVDTLRERLQLTGTKVNCRQGECGACTVIMDGEAVTSCLILAARADGSEITTIEGLSKNGELDEVQQAFIDRDGAQCGFCTPGMIMSAKALLMKNPDPTRDEIKTALAGNLCRCTGYAPIKNSVDRAVELLKEHTTTAKELEK
ncbi:MAG: (2Fe-2S)-binding protein [Spirochaetota bacterium]